MPFYTHQDEEIFEHLVEHAEFDSSGKAGKYPNDYGNIHTRMTENRSPNAVSLLHDIPPGESDRSQDG